MLTNEEILDLLGRISPGTKLSDVQGWCADLRLGTTARNWTLAATRLMWRYQDRR